MADKKTANLYNLVEGRKFRKLRKSLNMTQGQMAEMLTEDEDSAVGIKSISCWENGERKIPGWVIKKAEVLAEQCQALNIPETEKGTVIKHKNALLAAMAKRIKEIFNDT